METCCSGEWADECRGSTEQACCSYWREFSGRGHRGGVESGERGRRRYRVRDVSASDKDGNPFRALCNRALPVLGTTPEQIRAIVAGIEGDPDEDAANARPKVKAKARSKAREKGKAHTKLAAARDEGRAAEREEDPVKGDSSSGAPDSTSDSSEGSAAVGVDGVAPLDPGTHKSSPKRSGLCE